jgi:membrane fusion protein, multidrug efflux system
MNQRFTSQKIGIQIVLSSFLIGCFSAEAQSPNPRSVDSEVRLLVVADRESTLSAPTPGRIGSINVHLGDSVRNGQIVASFDCAEIEARHQAAKAELNAARLQHEAKIKLQALQSAAEVEVELAAANVDKFEAQLKVFVAQINQCRFTASFRGTVARIYVKQGQSVATGAPIIDLIASENLHAKLNIPSKWLSWLKIDNILEATVDETGRSYRLRISRLAGRVDAVSQTMEVEADFIGSVKDLMPGMSGRARPPQKSGS